VSHPEAFNNRGIALKELKRLNEPRSGASYQMLRLRF
jgi:hypothetical protein